MPEMTPWDICRRFVTVREDISNLRASISAYSYEEAEQGLAEVEKRLYAIELNVEAYFAPDWDECKKLQRAETPVQRETE